MDAAPHDRVVEFFPWVRGVPRKKRPTYKERRQDVLAWAKGKKSRMTPWGIQIYNRDEGSWLPPLPAHGIGEICGRWIRQIEVPEAFAGHPYTCTCYGRPPPKLSFTDFPHWSSNILQAFNHDEVTDPTLDLAEKLRPTSLPESPSKSCLLTELPPELFEIILDYLIPTGQTYQFFPTRNGTASVQIMQKFVPEKLSTTSDDARPSSASACLPHMQPTDQFTSKHRKTGSAYTSLAGTCKQMQDMVYSRLFGHNAFIFHLTPHTIHSDIRSSSFTNFTCWTRTTKHPPKAFGPLTGRAAKHLKHVTLIALPPFSHGSKDIKDLSALVEDAARMLSDAKLSHLAVALNLSKPGSIDNRRVQRAISADLVQAEVDGEGVLSLSIRDPQVQPVRESNKTQKVLAPLLQGPKGVKEVVLSGPLSERFAKELEGALKAI